MAAADAYNSIFTLPPVETAHGALLNHITSGAESDSFQPMNINFGLFPPPTESESVIITANGKRRKLKGLDRKAFMANRALTALASWSA